MPRLAYPLVLAAALGSTRTADANSCLVSSPVVEVQQLPAGCPAVVHVSRTYVGPFTQIATAYRATGGGHTEPVDVTGNVEVSQSTMPVQIDEIDESCVEWQGIRDEVFDTYTFELSGALPGDQVAFGSFAVPSAEIVEAGPCPPVGDLFLWCTDPIQEFEACEHPDGDGVPDPDDAPTPDDTDGGCAAGGSSSLGAALASLALRRRRRAR